MRVAQYLILQTPAWKTVQLCVHCVFHCGYIRACEMSLKYSPVLETDVVDRSHFAIRIRPAQSEKEMFARLFWLFLFMFNQRRDLKSFILGIIDFIKFQ